MSRTSQIDRIADKLPNGGEFPIYDNGNGCRTWLERSGNGKIARIVRMTYPPRGVLGTTKIEIISKWEI